MDKDEAGPRDLALTSDAWQNIFAFLPITSSQVSFVCQSWYGLARKSTSFATLYQFLDTYNQCDSEFEKDRSLNKAFEIMKTLRDSFAGITVSLDDRRELVNIFLNSNYIVLAQLQSPPFTLIPKPSKALTQAFYNNLRNNYLKIMVFRIQWDHLKYGEEPLCNKILNTSVNSPLRVFLCTSVLKKYFEAEDRFDITCKYAEELCARGESPWIMGQVNKEVNEQRGKALQERCGHKAITLCTIAAMDETKWQENDYMDAINVFSLTSTPDHKKRLEFFTKLDNRYPNNLTAIYYDNAGSVAICAHEFEKAIEFHNKALEKDANSKVHTGLAFSYMNLAGLVHEKEIEYCEKSAEHYKKGLKSESYSPSLTYAMAGYVHAKIGRIYQAAEYFHIFIDRIEEQLTVTGHPDFLQDFFQTIYDVLSETKAEQKYLDRAKALLHLLQ